MNPACNNCHLPCACHCRYCFVVQSRVCLCLPSGPKCPIDGHLMPGFFLCRIKCHTALRLQASGPLAELTRAIQQSIYYAAPVLAMGHFVRNNWLRKRMQTASSRVEQVSHETGAEVFSQPILLRELMAL